MNSPSAIPEREKIKGIPLNIPELDSYFRLEPKAAGSAKLNQHGSSSDQRKI